MLHKWGMSDESDEIYEKFHRVMAARSPQIANQDSGHMPAAQKMEIYKAIARLRLLSCIRAAYPKTFAVMDENEFERIALDFIQANPPESHELKSYPEKFAAFVCEHLNDAAVCQMAQQEKSAAAEIDC